MIDETYLTSREMAAKMRVAEVTLRQWRMKREGPPFVQFGRRILYPLSQFVAWAQDRVQAGKPKG